MKEKEFVEKIERIGGKAYIVGGWVRDTLRGQIPQDKDYVIVGVVEELFCDAFPDALKVGKSFPVYLVEVAGKNTEVAFAREEEKNGIGYRGFAVRYAPTVTIEDDLYRRDTTMNSMAISLATGELIDPYGGKEDIAKRVIRATSKHFIEDPVRALRAARQAAQTGFDVTGDTVELMRYCRAELATEPQERILLELTKALHSKNPSLFFRCLQQAGLLAITYPEIYALIGQSQPLEYHPKGDAFVHTLLVLDETAALTERIEVRFAALVHDLGKGLTKAVDLPHHYGHDTVGVNALYEWNRRMTLPRLWIFCARFAIEEHMRVTKLQKPGKIVAFLLALEKSPLRIDGFQAIIQADHGSVPAILADYARSLTAIHRVRGVEVPAELRGKAIGEWIRQRQISAYQNR